VKIPHWVIDTNVLISAAISPGGICDQLLQLVIAGRLIPAWDHLLLREYRDVLERPKFGLSKISVRELLSALPQSGFVHGVAIKVALPDSDDVPFVAVALATEERTIITGNAVHFPTSAMKKLGVRILSPREALNELTP
jgi:putative PIN family toxin of toxin-antitoxin system